MNKIVNAIQVDEKNIADIFKLPCVHGINKTNTEDIELWVRLRFLSEDCYLRRYPFIAHASDWLCELDDNTWQVLTDKQYQTIKQNNYVLH